ncbi:hypothetical protein DDY07_05230 [Methylomonas sp. ZR1]|nr:hypothetical protein [Methylomonas sp. ZR1]
MCSSTADHDPLIPGSYLIPAWATTVLAPEAGPNEVAVFNGTDWALFSDYRGTDYYLADGSRREISAIGDTVPAGSSLIAPVYYQYDPATGEFLGIADPLTRPAHHTLLAPLAVTNAKEVAVFDGDAWVVSEDNRGDVWDTATGIKSHHSALGPLPGNLTAIPKPNGFYSWSGNAWVVDYAAARAAKIAKLKLACAAQITSGIEHDALGTIHRYPTTKDDQQFMTARFSKAQAVGSAGDPYKFMCADNAGVWARRDHSASQITAVALAMEAHITDTLNHLDTRLAVLNSKPDDLDQIESVNW